VCYENIHLVEGTRYGGIDGLPYHCVRLTERLSSLDGIIQKGGIFTQIQVSFHGDHIFHVLVQARVPQKGVHAHQKAAAKEGPPKDT
jgi:hypothetical protein